MIAGDIVIRLLFYPLTLLLLMYGTQTFITNVLRSIVKKVSMVRKRYFILT